MKSLRRIVAGAALLLALATASGVAVDNGALDNALLGQASELSLAALEPLPADPTNRVADSAEAAELGHRLFFDTRLSSNGQVSCATCHDPRRDFQDGTPLAKGVGTTDRRTMPIAATAHSPFLFWDGRKDSQWAQALGPLESPVEHGGSRAQYAHVVAEHYRAEYERLFGALPDLREVPHAAGPVADPQARAAWERMSQSQRDAVTGVFVNVGKAIAAYERQIGYGASRFDNYVAEWQRTGTAPAGVLTPDEVAGMALFAGKANCVQCHNGPLLTNNEFHVTGVSPVPGLPADRGRLAGLASVKADEFNCRSRWSDAKGGECAELEFLPSPSPLMERAYKVPSLRNVAQRAPYMHAGQLASLADVLDHYNRAPGPRTELKPLGLTPAELRQLEAFLRSLSGGLDAPAKFLAAPTARKEAP